ncbi:cation transporter [Pacificimonas flava]|uniref:Cobalt-zinc-cadmium resistance protein CzcD n=1 Tax=Pacificimonas flava TaxID=1234595 RepID=M2T7U6_9SPHN|nr:cation transporter [Pacificimonas flava]EMD82599.1 Cobalt-zinc-cadmium resistance protein CzcD [Pacificimonas flava]MBB5281426.1 cation diffusion facilitator family transporter [Pacificimonas flava]
MSDCCSVKSCELEKLARVKDQRRALVTVLLINAGMFVAEFAAGLVSGSAALMADSVDMAGDAFVYALSLYALSRGERWKAGAATAKGVFILIFGLAVVVQMIARISSGLPPEGGIMLVFGGLALAANLICLRILWRFRAQDVNMSSTFECSRNDVIANVGVLIAAGLVSVLHSPWPDIVMAGLIAAVFLRSAIRILRAAVPQLRAKAV